MYWFKSMSHPYILPETEKDRLSVLLCCQLHSSGDGETQSTTQQDHACLVSHLS